MVMPGDNVEMNVELIHQSQWTKAYALQSVKVVVL